MKLVEIQGQSVTLFWKKEFDTEEAHLLHGLAIYNEHTRESISLKAVRDSFAHSAQLPSS